MHACRRGLRGAAKWRRWRDEQLAKLDNRAAGVSMTVYRDGDEIVAGL